MSRIVALRSGGQSGADRGAMDAAVRCGVPAIGWCPAGGWAEDYPDPPGVLALYPEMIETPSPEVIQRTEWNIRDSTCCIAFTAGHDGISPGTDAGFAFYEKYSIPHLELPLNSDATRDELAAKATEWLESLDDDAIVLSIGGPRASEYEGVYDIVFNITSALLKKFA